MLTSFASNENLIIPFYKYFVVDTTNWPLYPLSTILFCFIFSLLFIMFTMTIAIRFNFYFYYFPLMSSIADKQEKKSQTKHFKCLQFSHLFNTNQNRSKYASMRYALPYLFSWISLFDTIRYCALCRICVAVTDRFGSSTDFEMCQCSMESQLWMSKDFFIHFLFGVPSLLRMSFHLSPFAEKHISFYYYYY